MRGLKPEEAALLKRYTPAPRCPGDADYQQALRPHDWSVGAYLHARGLTASTGNSVCGLEGHNHGIITAAGRVALACQAAVDNLEVDHLA